jgi:hypothetical protein
MSDANETMHHLRLRARQRKSGKALLALVTAIGFLLLLVAGVPGSTQGPAKKVVTKQVLDGDFASAFAPFEIGGQLGDVIVEVNRGGSPQNPQTSLFYAVTYYYPPLFTRRSGFGLIPNGDLKVIGQKIVLNTDTSAIPDFTNTICTPNEEACGPGIGGVISVEWTKTNAFSESSKGISEFTFGGTTMRSVGSFSSTSASARGNALGTVFQTSFGRVGTNHQVERTIERVN